MLALETSIPKVLELSENSFYCKNQILQLDF